MEKKYYIRFGKIPDNEKSGIYSYQEQKIIGSENGVSVYDCCRIGDDWRIVLPMQCKESTLDTLYGLLVDGKDIYILSGDEVGVGSDNEPLIRNCNIVCKLPNNYFSLWIENEEIVQVTEWNGGTMVLTKQELDWLQLAIEDNNKYHISVDNDCISIDECVDEENDEWDSVFVFDNYGQDLIVQLFNYIGCNANHV